MWERFCDWLDKDDNEFTVVVCVIVGFVVGTFAGWMLSPPTRHDPEPTPAPPWELREEELPAPREHRRHRSLLTAHLLTYSPTERR